MAIITAEKLIERYENGERKFSGIELSNANLSKANLSGTDLSNTDLSYANLSYANLNHANLSGACLDHTNLGYANLQNACLNSAYLNSADLGHASLQYADMGNAQLHFANLRHACFQWVSPPCGSHAFWAELLSRKAQTNEQRQLVCLIAGGQTFYWCWDEYLSWGHPLQDWAIAALQSYDLNLENCPTQVELLLKKA